MITRPPSRQPIPPDARSTFKGSLFEVFNWNCRQFDGSVRVFEKVRRPDTAYILPVVGSEVLIARQKQPGSEAIVGPFGGRIEVGEAPEDAARRELAEEAGLECGELELWDSWHPLTKVDWAVYLFIARACTQVAAEPDAGEAVVQPISLNFDGLLAAAADRTFTPEVALFLLRLSTDLRRRTNAEAKLFPATPI